MNAAFEALGVSKRFGGVTALDGFSLSIPEGGVYGLLGPNGAGKSTLFRIALDLVRPTKGEVRVLGAKAGSDLKVMRKVGSMIETPRYPPFLTALDTLRALGHASGVRATRAELMRRLERMGIAEAADRKVHGFSVGMKQRLGIAAALISEPRLLILDEPTSGMDPAGIQEMRRLIRELSERDGVTVLLSSHLLDEVQKVCDRVAIIDHGKLSSEGKVSELIAGQEKLRLTVSPVATALEVLGDRGVADGDDVVATVTRAEAPALIRELVGRGVDVTETRWVGGDLEQIFLQQTGDTHAG